jgi:serine carboxypeptidase-like clade 2
MFYINEGFTQEIGPCLMQPGATTFDTTLNPYAWNNDAHVLFLENPPGVGFSQNEDKSFEYNENNTAANAYLALIQWFNRFPELKGRDFWITGESYCGMYIPYLANEILSNNAQAKPEDKINLKGIMIGNGVMLTNLHWRRQARDTFYGKHQFYGPEITTLMKSCTYNDSDNTKPTCLQAQNLADKVSFLIMLGCFCSQPLCNDWTLLWNSNRCAHHLQVNSSATSTFLLYSLVRAE